MSMKTHVDSQVQNYFMKTHSTFKTLALLAISCISITSCDKSIESVNNNPNRATDAPLSALFNGTMVSIIQPHEGENARLAGMWSQQFSGNDRSYAGLNLYITKGEDFDWGGFYYSIVNLDIIIAKSNAENNDFYSAAAKIVKAHQFGTMTSLWGKIPFSQAGDINQYPNPKFDDQVGVYAGVQQLLDEGISELENGVNTGDDLYFNGDKSAWIKLAHTLKARYYLHVRDYNNALAQAQQGIDATSGNWMIPHTGGVYNQDMNLYYSFGQLDRQGYLLAFDAYLPTIMDTSVDHNGMRNHTKTDEGERFAHYYTIRDGITGNYDLNYEGMWTATSSFPLATVHENLLIEAECENRLGNHANALNRLNDVRAILASEFTTGKYDAFDLSDFDIGGIEDNGKGGQSENLLYEILEEKYASLIGQIEVFCDMRRNDFPLGFSPLAGSEFPERFLIPQDEIDGNNNAPSPIPGVFEPTQLNQ